MRRLAPGVLEAALADLAPRVVDPASVDRWQQEADAVRLVLRAAGLDAELPEWQPPERDQPFLTGLVGDPHEATLIDNDVRMIPGWRGSALTVRERKLRAVLAEHAVAGPDELRDAVRQLWADAAHREERYLALSLLGHRRHAAWLNPSWVPLLREWIVTGAWWDFTDEIASRRIGPLLRARPGDLTPVLRAWMVDEDRWLRRTTVICQLGSRGDTDTDLLRAAVEANVADADFFLRKGIGWALRQHARTDPGWVRTFVAEHPGLSPLSRREALRRIAAG